MSAANRQALFAAFWRGEEEGLTSLLSEILLTTISFHVYHENFYHAFLAGLFVNSPYMVLSNVESGEGRPDLLVQDRQHNVAAILRKQTCGFPTSAQKNVLRKQ